MVDKASLEPPLRAFNLKRRLASEMIGTALLLAVVIGSGIMGEHLANGNEAIALLGNTIATGAALVVLIISFGHVSGAHFNPVVTLAFLMQKEIENRAAFAYIIVQILGAILGVYIAHAMFAESIFQVATKVRSGPSQIFSEFIATFGLIMAIFCSLRFRPESTAMVIGLYIVSAYWFTASTSFANPAVTIARSLSDTFAGIAPNDVAGFVIGQILGALGAVGFINWLFKGMNNEQ